MYTFKFQKKGVHSWRWENLVFQFVFFALFLLLFLNKVVPALKRYLFNLALDGDNPYETFHISDWLINYEGGFVRRGLIGEILYQIYSLHPYPVVHAIVWIYLLGIVAFLTTLWFVFKKKGWSVFIIPFLMFVFSSLGIMSTRRDYWALLLTLVIFYFYSETQRNSNKKYLIGFYLFSFATILMHEASFFFTFPLLILHYGYTHRKEVGKGFLKTVMFWMPVCLIMLLVCLYKGNEQIAQAIWASWEPCFRLFPMGDGELPQMGQSVTFLTNDTFYAIKYHFPMTWLGDYAGVQKLRLPAYLVNIYVFLCLYFLITRLNTINLGFYELKDFDRIQLSNIILIQFIALIPMFGFLSCDLVRTIPYWLFSSLFAFCYLNDKVELPAIVTKTSVILQKMIDKIPILRNRWVYFLFLITLPPFAVALIHMR